MNATNTANAYTPTLSGWPLRLGRIGWALLTLIVVGLDIYAIPTLYNEALIPCQYADPSQCGDAQYTVGQLAQLQAHGISAGWLASANVALQTTTTLIFVAVAAVIFWRRSDDRMALFAACMLVSFGGAGFNGAMQSLPDANPAWFVPTMALNVIGQVLFIIFFFVFPDGRFVPRWTRWVAVLWTLAWLGNFFPGTAIGAVVAVAVNGPLFIPFILLLVAAQVYRYRRVSNVRQRQQTKWVVYSFGVGLGAFALLVALGNTTLASVTENILAEIFFNILVYAFITLIPISISIAILRSRLYDIDVIINRTLVYGALTLISLAIYVLALLSRFAAQGVSEQQPILIVITTLLIAALFNPLRRLLQRGIDRRFYRTKYDVERTLAEFGATLRGEVNLETLTVQLVSTVEETMRPERASLWLRAANTFTTSSTSGERPQ